MTTITSQPYAGSNSFRPLTESISPRDQEISHPNATKGADPLTALLASYPGDETDDLTYDITGKAAAMPDKDVADIQKSNDGANREAKTDWKEEIIRTTSLDLSPASSRRDLWGERLRFDKAMHAPGVRPEDIVRNFVPEGMTKESVYELTPEAYQTALSNASHNASEREQRESWALHGIDFDAYWSGVDSPAYAAMGVPGSIQTLQNAIDFYNSTHKTEIQKVDPETLTDKQRATRKMLEDTSNYWKKRAKDQLDRTISSLFNSYDRRGNLIETDANGRVSVGAFELSYKGVQIYRPNGD
ncbi:hypothetical protein EXN61_12705 [Agrobacterium tumefaciens]|uniref:Uncharacterized protein n=1 Tax=Agrobacterium tumefaciens TaxID=358 RepID=A0A546XZ91_AGRTU|nr:hypothetical protein [Agrobacterium tumefaciens]TRB06064.1 hypothetical protein EXN61_12705 [Agrobacterium tumefaciens]